MDASVPLVPLNRISSFHLVSEIVETGPVSYWLGCVISLSSVSLSLMCIA